MKCPNWPNSHSDVTGNNKLRENEDLVTNICFSEQKYQAA